MTWIAESLYQSASVRRWIEGVVETLADGRSVIAAIPATVDADEILAAIVASLARRDVSAAHLQMASVGSEDGPRYAFWRALGVSDVVSRPTPEGDPGAGPLRELPGVVVLEGLEGLRSDVREGWLRFIAEPGRSPVGGTAADDRVALLCWLRDGGPALEVATSEGSTVVVLWWGLPSATEVRLLCRWNDEEGSEEHRLWREHVLPSLAGADTVLAERLWASVTGSLGEIVSVLEAVAQDRGWTGGMLAGLGVDRVRFERPVEVGRAMRLPRALWALWAAGVLGYTPEYGTEVSSVALVALGRRDEVAHRLWRAQAAFLLPTLDGLRRRVCEYLTETYGVDWPHRWLPGEAGQERDVPREPMMAEWGFLWHLYRSVGVLRADHKRTQMVGHAWWVRNELAHSRPVPYEAFRMLWSCTNALSSERPW